MQYNARDLPLQWRLFCRHHPYADGAVVNDHVFGTDEQLDVILCLIASGEVPQEAPVRRLSRNRSRKYGDRRTLLIKYLPATSCSINPTSHELIEHKEQVEWVRAITSAREFAALWMLANDYTYKEIAGRLGVSVGTLKSRVARCRQRLRRHPECRVTSESAARSLRGRRKTALHIDAKRCIPTTYCGPNGLKTFCRADS